VSRIVFDTVGGAAIDASFNAIRRYDDVGSALGGGSAMRLASHITLAGKGNQSGHLRIARGRNTGVYTYAANAKRRDRASDVIKVTNRR
jgi:hypothetical protein